MPIWVNRQERYGRAASDRSDYVFNFKQPPSVNRSKRLTDIFHG